MPKRKITLTIDTDLYECLKLRAKREGRSISNLVCWLLNKLFKDNKPDLLETISHLDRLISNYDRLKHNPHSLIVTIQAVCKKAIREATDNTEEN